ncbi:hypothetical protein JAAARDRAFT_112888, partial [Jaapia argillacea MUCL 33604]
HRFVGLVRLHNGGILFELNSAEAADWVRSNEVREHFLRQFNENASMKSRTFSLIARFIPLSFQPDIPSALREVKEANSDRIASGSLVRARWVKPVYRRDPTQTCGHVILVFSDVKAANTAILNGLLIRQKRIQVEKTKKEPLRCLKCQGWNHIAAECVSEKEVCGTCGQDHRTEACANKGNPHCVSCESDHMSWSRFCPTFLRKCLDLDERMQENSMPYFPTDEAWT